MARGAIFDHVGTHRESNHATPVVDEHDARLVGLSDRLTGPLGKEVLGRQVSRVRARISSGHGYIL